MRFDDFDFEPDILDAIDSMNFTECTPIQEQSIPVIMDGHDLIGVAQTGTGKTAAYLLPVLNELSKGGYPPNAINCVVMSPTRELAQQIDQQVQGFSYFAPISSVAVYGGNDGIRYEQERRGMAMGTDIVIATPGRLISHISLGNIDLSKVSFFILDEADRMLDMGFHDDIMQIVSQLPKTRQTLLFSATMPKEIQELAGKILNNPVEIKLAVSKPAEKIHQQACICHEPQKILMLIRFLKKFYGGEEDGFVKDELLQNPDKRVVVFVSRKVNVKDVVLHLRKKGFKVAAMHSDLEQRDREEVMNAFKAGRTNVLVATDIVSRGIDINGIELVVNFDLPHDPEDYVHRIGRTARADHDGESLTFVNRDNRIEMRKFRDLEKFIGKQMDRIATPDEEENKNNNNEPKDNPQPQDGERRRRNNGHRKDGHARRRPGGRKPAGTKPDNGQQPAGGDGAPTASA